MIGIKHTKGWSYRLICGRCLGDRKEFMGEYGKAADKLVRMARAGSRKWQGEERDVPLGNGEFRWGKLISPTHQKLKNKIAAEIGLVNS